MVVEFVAVSRACICALVICILTDWKFLVYINSFLATLNSRNHLREMEGATDYTTSSGTKARANSQGPGVMVTTTSTHNVDITRPVNLSFKDTEGQLKGQDLELSEIQYESKGSPGMVGYPVNHLSIMAANFRQNIACSIISNAIGRTVRLCYCSEFCRTFEDQFS